MSSDLIPFVGDGVIGPVTDGLTWLSTFLGFGVILFTLVSAGATYASKVLCDPVLAGIVASGNVIAAGPCITAAVVGTLAGAIAGGLGTYGTVMGWTTEGIGSSVRRGEGPIYQPVIHSSMGISHHYDAQTHQALNETYGEMLISHNTTILSVTWLEKLPTANHTGRVFENLNMTDGRLITLNDNGAIRVAIGGTTKMGHILESFNEFKGHGNTLNPLVENGQRTVDWVSYNTYGENMREGAEYWYDFEEELSDVESDYAEHSQYNPSDDYYKFATQNSGESYPDKFCVGSSPTGNSVGKNSIIVGETYMNAWGGIDKGCQSG